MKKQVLGCSHLSSFTERNWPFAALGAVEGCDVQTSESPSVTCVIHRGSTGSIYISVSTWNTCIFKIKKF